MSEQKAKCEAIEKRENERRQIEEKKHTEEVQFLKRTNQQLKVSKKVQFQTVMVKLLLLQLERYKNNFLLIVLELLHL